MAHLRLILVLCTACASAMAQNPAAQLKVSDNLSLTNTPVPGAAATEGGPVGYVKTVTGLAFVVTQGIPMAANIGTPVMQGSVLKTGADSTLGVTFKDSTMLSFGPETELKVDEYTYQPADGKLKFGSSLVRGTLNYLSGVIAKLKPDSVSITTPSGMIGVRGTQFVAKVNPPTP